MVGERNPARDEPLAIPLDPESALRGLLKVAPEPESAKPTKPPEQDASEDERI